jgi:hypothetical protein
MGCPPGDILKTGLMRSRRNCKTGRKIVPNSKKVRKTTEDGPIFPKF